MQPFLNPTALNLCEIFASPFGVSTSISSLWLPLRLVEQYESTYRPIGQADQLLVDLLEALLERAGIVRQVGPGAREHRQLLPVDLLAHADDVDLHRRRLELLLHLFDPDGVRQIGPVGEHDQRRLLLGHRRRGELLFQRRDSLVDGAEQVRVAVARAELAQPVGELAELFLPGAEGEERRDLVVAVECVDGDFLPVVQILGEVRDGLRELGQVLGIGDGPAQIDLHDREVRADDVGVEQRALALLRRDQLAVFVDPEVLLLQAGDGPSVVTHVEVQREVARLLLRDGDLRDPQGSRTAAADTGQGGEQHGPEQRSVRLREHGSGAYTVAVRDRALRNSCSQNLRLSLAACVFFRHFRIAARVGGAAAAT